MIGNTIDPTMMIAPESGKRRKQQRDDRTESQRERERPLASVLGRQIDQRASDAGVERHPPEQCAEDDRNVDRRERGARPRLRSPQRAQSPRPPPAPSLPPSTAPQRSPAAGAGTSAPRRRRRRRESESRSRREHVVERRQRLGAHVAVVGGAIECVSVTNRPSARQDGNARGWPPSDRLGSRTARLARIAARYPRRRRAAPTSSNDTRRVRAASVLSRRQRARGRRRTCCALRSTI